MNLSIYGKDIKNMSYDEIEDFIKKINDENMELREENIKLKIRNHDLEYFKSTILEEEWDYKTIFFTVIVFLVILIFVYNLGFLNDIIHK